MTSREPRTDRVLTKEEQEKLTPAAVFDILRAGNDRFANATLTESAVLRDLEAEGRIRIVGGMYDMHTGRVEFYDPGFTS